MSKFTVMSAGHICVDITPVFNSDFKGGVGEVLVPGKLVNVEQAVISTGGSVANTGLAMAKFGVEMKLNGKVGDDGFGKIIKDIVGNDKVGSFKTVANQSSSYSIILAMPGVDRIILHNPGTNDTFESDDVDYQSLRECDIFHFGYPTLMMRMYEDQGLELVEIFKKAKDTGVMTSLDMSLPDPESESGKADWESIFEKVLPYVDVFLPSVEEIAFMLDRELFDRRKLEAGGDDPVTVYKGNDLSRLSDRLLGMGVKVAAIKVGIKGYYLRTAGEKTVKELKFISQIAEKWAGREIWRGSYKAERIGSATGAGDTTIAGFLTAMLWGLEPLEAVKAANAVGWQSVREIDALSGIQDWVKTMEMIHNENKIVNEFKLDEQGWIYDQMEKVYYGPNDKLNN